VHYELGNQVRRGGKLSLSRTNFRESIFSGDKYHTHIHPSCFMC